MTAEIKILRIEKAVFEGGTLAREDGLVIFVEGALPGELVEAQIVQRKRSFARARLTRVLEASPDRVEPPCPVYAACGGCRWQHAAYDAQVKIKEGFLREAFHFLPDLDRVLQPVHPSERPFRFRNKMEFSVVRNREKVIIGLHEKGRFESMVPADGCLLPSEEANALCRRLRETMESWPPDPGGGKRTAFPTRLMVRESRATGERMLAMRMTSHDREREQALTAAADAWCDTVLFSVPDPSRPRVPPKWRTAKGQGVLLERMGPWTFEIGPDTFFQTHTEQAEYLFGRIGEHASVVAPRRVCEWYAGTGALTHFLAAPGREVVALESAQASSAAARRNSDLNEVKGVRAVQTDVERWMPNPNQEPFDLIVVDPPRAGLTPAARRRLIEIAPPRIVYMSCHPATLARDLKALIDAEYVVEWIQPADMFPQTDHIETAVALRR